MRSNLESSSRYFRLLHLLSSLDLNIVAVIILAVWFLRLQRYDYFPEYPRIRRDFYPFVSVCQRTREASGEPSLLELFRAEAVFRAKPKERRAEGRAMLAWAMLRQMIRRTDPMIPSTHFVDKTAQKTKPPGELRTKTISETI